MNCYRAKLLNGTSVEEKLAGVLLLQKELEGVTDEALRCQLLATALPIITPVFLLQMCASPTMIVRKNGVYMILYMIESEVCCKTLLGYFDVILLITSAETNSELKMCLHSVCQNMSHLCSDADMSGVLECLFVYLMHQKQHGSEPGSGIAYYDPALVLEVCLQTCIVFHFSSGFQGHNWCKLLRNIIMVYVNGSRLKEEGQFDRWLILVFNLLKYSPTMQWTLDDGVPGASGTVKKVNTDSFPSFIIATVTTEIHLVLEELMCVYSEECELVYAFRLNRLSKASESIRGRYTRALRLLLVLCDYLDLFLDLLVSTSDDDDDYDDNSNGAASEKNLVTCWGELPYEMLLKTQSRIHDTAKECLQFVVDLSKAWVIRQRENEGGAEGSVAEIQVHAEVQTEFAMVVSRIVSSLCRWGRDDELIQGGILLKARHAMDMSALCRDNCKLIAVAKTNATVTLSAVVSAFGTCKSTVLASLRGVGNSGTTAPSGSGVAEVLTELYEHWCTSVDDVALVRAHSAQDAFIILALFLADIVAERPRSELTPLLESLALNSEFFTYHLVLLCHRAVLCLSDAAADITAALKAGNEYGGLLQSIRGNSAFVTNLGSLLRLLCHICSFYRGQIETLIKGERNVPLVLDRVLNNNSNQSGGSDGLYTHLDLLFQTTPDILRLAQKMVLETSTDNVTALVKPGAVPQKTRQQSLGEDDEELAEALVAHREGLVQLRVHCSALQSFCRGVLALELR